MIADSIPSEPPAALAQAQAALSAGDRRQAQEICVRLTTAEPANVEAWFWRALTAGTLADTIAALSQVLALDPAHAVARQALYEAMQQLLRQDAFLSYRGETEGFYQLQALKDFQFTHPKDRAAAEPFPPAAPPATRPAYRWLWLAVLGMLPAGLGALICAPVAMFSAVRLLRRPLSLADRRRAGLVLVSAAALWLVALGLGVLLVVHLR